MKPRVRVFGQPMHQILSVFPLGLLGTSFFFDIAWLVRGRAELATVSWWMIFAGVVGGALAAVFGLIDFSAIPRTTRARRVGMWHGIGTTVVVLLFALSWLLRRDAPAKPESMAIALSAVGVLLTVLTGWLGAQLADQMEEM